MKINVTHYFIYSSQYFVSVHAIPEHGVQWHMYVDIRQYTVTLLCFHLRKYICSTELQNHAEETHHMLAVAFWSALLPQATCRSRQDNSFPVSSNDFLRQGPPIQKEAKGTL